MSREWYLFALRMSQKRYEEAFALFKLLTHGFDHLGQVLQVEAELRAAVGQRDVAVVCLEAGHAYALHDDWYGAYAMYRQAAMLEPLIFDHTAKAIEAALAARLYPQVQAHIEQVVDLYQQSIVREDQLEQLVRSCYATVYKDPESDAFYQWFEALVSDTLRCRHMLPNNQTNAVYI